MNESVTLKQRLPSLKISLPDLEGFLQLVSGRKTPKNLRLQADRYLEFTRGQEVTKRLTVGGGYITGGFGECLFFQKKGVGP